MMKVIDSDNYSASGIETFFFPGGEPHARIPKDFGDALLYLKARTWNDLGIALCVLNALAQQEPDNIWLFAPYFPGARQDRTDGQTPWTINMMVDILSRYVDRPFVFDTHSSYTQNTVFWADGRNFMPSDLPRVQSIQNSIIIVPDEGAFHRCINFRNSYNFPYAMVQCEKKRDFATGKFIGFTMPPLPCVGNYLIVDDICDGGGTFNLLAEEFLKDPYGKDSTLELWVSHGIFSKGLDAIHPKIRKIYTTDSWAQYDKLTSNPLYTRLDVISLQPIVNKILEEYEYDKV
jgi:ribose-phosphate pyrophosphokinase